MSVKTLKSFAAIAALGLARGAGQRLDHTPLLVGGSVTGGSIVGGLVGWINGGTIRPAPYSSWI